MLETGRRILEYLDCFVVYYSIQLGRCVLFSFVALAVVLLLRHTCFKNRLFLKGMCWGVFLVIPFVGKLKLFYQTPWMVRMFWLWNHACMQFTWVRYGYLVGMLATATVIFIRRNDMKSYSANKVGMTSYSRFIPIGNFMSKPALHLLENRYPMPGVASA